MDWFDWLLLGILATGALGIGGLALHRRRKGQDDETRDR